MVQKVAVQVVSLCVNLLLLGLRHFDLTMKSLDRLRPYVPGFWQFVVVIACLQSVAAALAVNHVIAISLLLTFTASLVKIYKVDPEPVLLLLLHTAISGSMLYDVTTTLFVIGAALTSSTCLGGFELQGDRVTVLVMSTLIPVLMSKPLALLVGIAVAVVIVGVKLRPIKPQVVLLLTLFSIALILLVSRVAGSVMVLLLMAVVTGLFLLNKVPPKDNSARQDGQQEFSVHDHVSEEEIQALRMPVNGDVPNGYLQLTNPTESLDLHGHSVTGAMRVLNTFLRESEDAYMKNRANHLRHVTIITGDSYHDDELGPGPLIKPTVINFLKINRFRYEVSRETAGLIRVDLESHVM